MIVVRLIERNEAELLKRVAPDVFDKQVESTWAREFLEDARHHLAVAIDGDVIVGMASAVHYVHPDKPPELWINEVGVAPTHARRGLGTHLLQTLLHQAAVLGCVSAWVLTDPDNGPANALYRSIDGQAEPTVLYEFSVDQDPAGAN